MNRCYVSLEKSTENCLDTDIQYYILLKYYFTISNKSRTSFSDSPLYFDVKVEDETLKNVVPHSVATAFASIVLPVPGGPTMSTPFQGRLIP